MNDLPDINNYLDHVLDAIDPEIKLDDEQKAAVVADDDRALVVAGAGTGKTTTIAAKVKYLVDIKKVDPHKILIMSYTRKAVDELRRRINVDLEIPADITTFHSLGLRYLRKLNSDKKIIPIDDNERRKYFLKYLKEEIFPSQEKLNEMVSIFNDQQISWYDSRQHTYGAFFLENYKNYSSFDEYFDAYIKKKISETPNIVERVTSMADKKVNGANPVTIKGEFVKSKGEAVIANFLFCNEVDYSYERVYDELVGDQQIYRPDFSVDIGGEEIYIEYFGMSGGKFDNNSYERIRRKKEAYHREHNNKFIALDYSPNHGYLEVLKNKLQELGAKLYPKPIDEIYKIMLEQNPLAEFYQLESFVYNVIDTIKSSEKIRSFEDYKNLCQTVIDGENNAEDKDIKRLQLQWIEKYWDYYNEQKFADSSKLLVDYADMIKMPTGHLAEIIPKDLDFDYILVDEYQDISAARFNLLKETIELSDAKFFAIGDDWQSIYSFQGAKIGYILNFDSYFPGASKYIITRTYRNAQELINAAGEFVMQNGWQIKKDLKSKKSISRPIVFAKIKKVFPGGHVVNADRNKMIEKMIREIHIHHPNDSICVLGRTNAMIDTLFAGESNFIDSAENKVKIKGLNNFYFDAMTIHKSKGLTYDWTIVMPLTKSFPSDDKKEIWLLDIVKNIPEEEAIPYAEQRRLFYVALTRTKNRVYILLPAQGDHSKYKDELNNIINTLSASHNL